GHSSIWAHSDLEGSDYLRGPLPAILPTRARCYLQKRTSGKRRHPLAEFLVLRYLRLDGGPTAPNGGIPELAEQDRLAHASQSDCDHRLSGVTVFQAVQ